MNDTITSIISKVAEQSLPKFLTFLAGINLFVSILRDYCNIIVDFDYFDCITSGAQAPISFIIVLIIILVLYFCLECFQRLIIKFILDKKENVHTRLTILFCAQNLTDFFASSSALLLSIALQNIDKQQQPINALIILVIIGKVFVCVWDHNYYKYSKVAKDVMQNTQIDKI